MHAEPQTAPEQDAVPPGDDSNTDPTPPLPADAGGNGGERNPAASASPKPQPTVDEEPELNVGEGDIPSDGRDLEGEGMIRDLGRPVEKSSPKEVHGH